jgi:biopolymer transport protein TolR
MDLTSAQKNKIRRLAIQAPKGQETEGGELNVVPFLDIITNVLMFVLATVSVTFTATIDTNPPRHGTRPPESRALDLAVLVVPDGFSLKAQGGNVAPGCNDTGAGLAIPKRDGAYDYDALRTCAAKLKKTDTRFAGENGVTISANPQIPYDVVIATMDAVRTSTDGDDLFPQVSFGVGR